MQPLILLHGAIGASDQLSALAGELSQPYEVYSPDFPGHGGRDFPDESFSIPFFAQDVLQFMEQHSLKQADFFGYSMGGYVAMYLARHFPQKVNKLVTLATKFHWDETIAAREIKMLDPDKIEAKLPPFASDLAKRHAPADWKVLLGHTAEMLKRLGADNALKPEDYGQIQAPALVLLGDRDKMISFEETLQVYRALPRGAFGVLPFTPHPIEQVNSACLLQLIRQFTGDGAPSTKSN